MKFLDESMSIWDRLTAIEGLGMIGSRESLPTLKRLAESAEKAESEAAKKALEKLK